MTKNIPYKIYLEESEMPKKWYNMRADMKTTVLLETMAGKGSEVGGRFEEIREIIDRTELKEKMGVCLDYSFNFRVNG